jgi:hypothetical protein
MLKVYHSAGLLRSALPLQPFTGTLHYTFAFFPLQWIVEKKCRGFQLDDGLLDDHASVDLAARPTNLKIKSGLSEEKHGSR